jgi:hypothetical protein
VPTEDRCACCDLVISSCGKAVEERQATEARFETARLFRIPRAFAANFAGGCGRCGERFDIGAPILKDAFGGYRSLACCEKP